MQFLDRASIGTVKRTSDGYITARAKAVRTGVQDYLASELGMMGNDRVRVYRPPEEVFSKDSVSGFAHAPITNDHPATMVDANNWKDLAIGEVGANVMRDGEFLALDLILKDAKAIAGFDGGKKELSAGYTAELEFVDNHPEYDAVMRNIRINHLALVDKGRAGSEARIGDSAANQWGVSPLTTSKEVSNMEMKAVAIGDQAINVKAEDADALKKIVDGLQSAVGELKAKLADAESKVLSDEAVAALVKDRSDLEVMKAAIVAHPSFGDEAIKDASDAEIRAIHKHMPRFGDAKDETARKALADAMKNKAKEEDDPWAKVNEKSKKGAK